MRLKTFRHLWGITEPWKEAFRQIKSAGYDGVEYKGSRAGADPGFVKLLREYEFDFIAQIHTSGETVDDHIASFRTLIEASLPLNPLFINSQSGKDSWTATEKQEFVYRALEYEKELGIPIAHETHRGRITYNPWDTRDLLLRFGALKLCCDFSHWVCVCERIIDSERDIITLCADRCLHLHSRVGYEQGPQVSDPRAPEFARHLKAHEEWWAIIWQSQQARGMPLCTLTPEFGPPDYHHTLPFSREPVSDLREICDWMNSRQKERFHQFINPNTYVTVNRDHSKPALPVVDGRK